MAKRERKETLTVKGEWPVGEYTYKADRYLDEFVEGLKEKKIIGSICSSCGRVHVPPRYICGRCMTRIDQRTIVSDRGTINSYSITSEVKKGMKVLGMDPIKMGLLEEGERVVLARVQFDSSDSSIQMVVENVDPEDVHVGMRVKAIWRDEPRGELSDLLAVEPVK